jgi:alpha-amylase
VKTIHEVVAVKDPQGRAGLEKKLCYDRYERESLVDHCLPPGAALDEVETGQYEELADLVSSPYQVVERRRGREGLRVRLARQTTLRTPGGPSGSGPFLVEKEIALPLRGAEVLVDYHLRNLADEVVRFTFAVELNFSLLAGNAPDRYYFHQESPDGRSTGPSTGSGSRATSRESRAPSRDTEVRLGPLVSRHSLSAGEHVGLRDEWTGMELLLTAPGAAGWFLFPCESVSQSESGLELVYQSSCVMPYWAVALAPGASTRLHLSLVVRALPVD